MACVGCRERPNAHDLILAVTAKRALRTSLGASVDRPVFDFAVQAAD